MTTEDKKRINKIATHKRQQIEKDYAEKKQKAEQLNLNLFGDLKLIFGLTPEKALKWFQAKFPALSQNWYDIWGDANITSFTVAGVASMDLLMEIQNQLERALTEGITFAEFSDSIEEKLDSAGWISGEETLLPSRLTTIWRTNLKSAYSAGRYESMMENKQSRKYFQWRTMSDNVVRETHAELESRVFSLDDEIVKTHWPPLDFNCRCHVVAMNDRDLKRKNLTVENSADGEIKEIPVTLPDGTEKTVTTYIDKNGVSIPTGVGFSFNPGIKPYRPDLKSYPKELKKQYQNYLDSSG